MPVGQLTFDAEGLEKRGPFFSRTAQVPGVFSGVTIGRGYDMGARSASEIIADLTAAGIDRATAERFAEARGLTGPQAKRFVKQKKLKQLEITPAQQKALFLIVYKELEGDVMRICKKADVVDTYGHQLADTQPSHQRRPGRSALPGRLHRLDPRTCPAICRGKRPGRIYPRPDQAKLLGGAWCAA